MEARFNRLLLFVSDRFHSRSIHDNYGADEDARLVQVTFGTGDLETAMRRKEQECRQ